MKIVILVLFVFIHIQLCFCQFESLIVSGPISYTHVVKRDVEQILPTVNEFSVNTKVANRFAETLVISRVENADSVSNQATFSVVLPARALISEFLMEIEGKIYKAVVKRREDADAIYQQSINGSYSAAHVFVSTRDSNRFTINVNVEPQSTVNFYLTYQELLQRENGQYEIVINVQPGQIVKNLKVEVEINEDQPLTFVKVPSLRSGNNMLITNDTDLDPQADVEITNKTSAMIKFNPDIKKQLQYACAGLGGSEDNDGFIGQFVVQYDVERNPGGAEIIYQDGFFINYFAPPDLEPLEKHVVFVLDTSGSMGGLRMTQLKEAMDTILSELNEEDLVDIIQFENDVYVWDLKSQIRTSVIPNPDLSTIYGNLASIVQNQQLPGLQYATSSTIQIAKSIVQNQFVASGLTNIVGALEVALFLVDRVQKQLSSYQPLIIFLTDGEANVGLSSTTSINNVISKVNADGYKTPIYSLSFGDGADQIFLHQLSYNNFGSHVHIYEAEDASVQLTGFYKKISNPVLSNVNLANLPQSQQVTKYTFPIYFNGSEIIVAGSGATLNETMSITITARGKNGTVQLQPKIGVSLANLEKIWAYLTVKQILEQRNATTNKTELTEKAVDLALAYSLVTEVSSLVVVRPNDTNSTVDTVDAANGVMPKPAGELSMCSNITDWIIEHIGTTEEPTTITTTIPPTPTIEEITTTIGSCQDTVEEDFSSYSSDSCSLSKDQGTCFKFTKKWYFDQKSGTCTTFWYRGCNGNANRFNTEEECNRVCVNPIGINRCKLPAVKGSCKSSLKRWYYDNTDDTCKPFIYGGCNGNNNRFNSECECKHLCSGQSKEILYSACEVNKDSGPCRDYTINWYYDTKSGICRQFWYGGCKGNLNRFPTEKECENICVKPSGPERCYLPAVQGPCGKNQKLWYYDKNQKSCTKFTYGGCYGNNNRFDSKKECEKICE